MRSCCVSVHYSVQACSGFCDSPDALDRYRYDCYSRSRIVLHHSSPQTLHDYRIAPRRHVIITRHHKCVSLLAAITRFIRKHHYHTICDTRLHTATHPARSIRQLCFGPAECGCTSHAIWALTVKLNMQMFCAD